MKLNTILLAVGMLIVGGAAGHFITKSMNGENHDHSHDHQHQKNEQKAQTNQASQNPFEKNTDPLAEAASKPALPQTTMKFDEMEHDFGTIEQGDKVTHVFKFKNTGNEPLVIDDAKGSCGCTVPKWPKDPISPGEYGEMKVEYDSKGKRNQEVKTVTIMANTEPQVTRLTIKAYVNAPDQPEASNTIKQ